MTRLDVAMAEIQLGHLCNDRCVFCISGERTRQGRAPLLDADRVMERIRAARAAGHRRLTFLGGEPTLQPFFLEAVRLAVDLGFEEIVIFTNGSKTGRTDLIDRVVETGGRFEWRFSFQGATEEAHEATTRRRGSFRQLLRSVERCATLGQKITVNICVVTQNAGSLDAFPALLAPLGVRQLHVDMLHPDDMDARVRAEALASMLPRYPDLVGPLTRMIAGFAPDFDVNVGNLPHCFAPALAGHIHHGGMPTVTSVVAVDGSAGLIEPWDKYRSKDAGRIKVAACRQCVFDGACRGVFADYAQVHGLEGVVPVSTDDLAALRDPHGRTIDPGVSGACVPPADGVLEGLLERLRRAAPFGRLAWRETRVFADGRRVEVALEGPDLERAVVYLDARDEAPRAGYRIEGQGVPGPALEAGLRAVMVALGRLPARAMDAHAPGAVIDEEGGAAAG
jgi:MoaA/NifB/PqqE/SkfB family radical SAM enzyme